MRDRTVAAWLWSRREGVVTGLAASALHVAKWVDDAAVIELNLPNNKSPNDHRRADVMERVRL